MPDTPPNGHLARNALLIAAAAAAGLGLFAFSLAGNPAALAKGARDLGRSLRQRLDDAGELVGRVQGAPRQRALPRKVAVDEPMAGYGA